MIKKRRASFTGTKFGGGGKARAGKNSFPPTPFLFARPSLKVFQNSAFGFSLKKVRISFSVRSFKNNSFEYEQDEKFIPSDEGVEGSPAPGAMKYKLRLTSWPAGLKTLAFGRQLTRKTKPCEAYLTLCLLYNSSLIRR